MAIKNGEKLKIIKLDKKRARLISSDGDIITIDIHDIEANQGDILTITFTK